MNEITFTLGIKPIMRRYEIFNTPCKEPCHGLGAAECECGQSFVAFMRDPSTEYTAFVDAVARTASLAMERIGEPAPFAGGVNLCVLVMVKRPQRHFEGNDPLRALKPSGESQAPTGSPSMVQVLDSIQTGLAGVTFDNRNQITGFDGTAKEYGEADSITITVTQTRTGNKNQLELF
jgi:hypothetical protein